MCINMSIRMCIDMCMDMCIDTYINMCIYMCMHMYYLRPKTHVFGAIKSSFCMVCLDFFAESFSFEVRAFKRYVVCLVWTMLYRLTSALCTPRLSGQNYQLINDYLVILVILFVTQKSISTTLSKIGILHIVQMGAT